MRLIIIIIIFSIGILATIFIKPNLELSHKGERIVALSPAHTKILKYLGLGDKLIAISYYDQDPDFQNLYKITGGVHVDEEELLALKPDLVLIGDTQQSSEIISFLSNHNITTLTLKTTSFQEIYDSLLALQNLFPKTIHPEIIPNFYTKWQSIKKSTPSNLRSALIVIGIDPIYSISTNNYLNELYYYSGWSNVVTSTASYPVISEEYLLTLPPAQDIIISSFFTNELAYISNVQKQIKAENIIILTQETYLPSPYLLDIIKELRTQQNSLSTI